MTGNENVEAILEEIDVGLGRIVGRLSTYTGRSTNMRWRDVFQVT